MRFNPAEPPEPGDVGALLNTADDTDTQIAAFRRAHDVPNPWAEQASPRRERPSDDESVDPEDAPETIEGDLSKRAFGEPGARRKLALTRFLKSRLAIGESAHDVIAYAAQHDEATAILLRECAAEIAA